MTEDMRVESGESTEATEPTAPSASDPIDTPSPAVENGTDTAQVESSGTPAASEAADFEVAQELGAQAPVDESAADAPTAPAAAGEQPAVAEPPAASQTPAVEPSAVPQTPATDEGPAVAPVPAAVESPAADGIPAADGPAAADEPTSTDTQTPAAAPPVPRPNPGRRPGGRPGGPAGGRPAVVPGGRGGAPRGGPGAPVPVEPTVEPTDPHRWGRIDEAGVVYVFGPSGERAVGNWQAGDAEAGLAHFARRFDDFATEIALLETRLATGSGDPKATRAHAIELRESVDTLPGIGDLDSAAARLEIVIGAADAAIAGASTARAAARAVAVAAKEALCVEAETLADSEQWKSTGDRLKEIVEEWRTIKGIDRKTDDALWKRFAKARDAFTRHRGTHFADLDKQRSAAKDAKEALIAKAEALADSTEWGRTAGEYRTLMEEWKASGRAPRDVEDALWDRFRAAQEKFFSHRNQTFSERDQEFETNAAIKEKLLAEAEKIDPAGGLDAAKAALRSIQERWEAAGKVPRERIKEFDSRLRAVEDKIRSAEDSHWRRTDPETTARIEQFRSRATTYRAQADKARAAGNERKAKEAEAQAVQWEEWLAAAESVVKP